MNCTITNPISSNQVTEVGLLKPRCATFEGNTLNDWLKWLSNKQCEIDWASFDLTCLRAILQEKTYCEQTQKEVIQTILDALCELSSRQGSSETVESVNVENAWSATQTIRVYKKGRQVILSGIVDSGNVNSTICTLPVGYRPNYTLRLPVRTLNTFADTYEASIQITSSGVVTVAYKGVSPVIATSSSIFLDGISFFI